MKPPAKRYAMRISSFIRAVDHFKKMLAYLNVLITQDSDGDYSHAHLDICHAISRIDAHLNFLIEQIGKLPVKESMINLPSDIASEMNIYVELSNEAIERLREHNIILTEN
tara:strand:- start:1078 stop:1410 length:333 start_codon:yes stop_codon:yes gene_type:complete